MFLLPVSFSINADYFFLQFTIPIDNGDSVKNAEADSQRTLSVYLSLVFILGCRLSFSIMGLIL